jgi:hypothetical protein
MLEKSLTGWNKRWKLNPMDNWQNIGASRKQRDVPPPSSRVKNKDFLFLNGY